ncbi:translesion error-prone DNA polymerase V autoproteolytic subunit [bacterium]|nr:translesion error-prone DNA polymerase V autoproteolytic subunit [bacterium]
MTNQAKRGRGRPVGEPTTVVRIPTRHKAEVMDIVAGRKSLRLPFFSGNVSASFGAAPLDEYVEETLDLNDRLVRNPSSTFVVKATGDSMVDAGIHDGNLLLVDSSIKPMNNHIVVAALHGGELTVKRMRTSNVDEVIWLCPENEKYKPLKVTQDMQMKIWGVVTNIIHELI